MAGILQEVVVCWSDRFLAFMGKNVDQITKDDLTENLLTKEISYSKCGGRF